MQRKRLLILIDNLMIGGAQNVVSELINNLDFDRYETRLMCYGIKRNTPVEKRIEAICPVNYMNINGSIKLFDMIRVLWNISKIKPDIIHAHLGGITFGLPWCLMHRKPLAVTVHTIPERAFGKKNEKQLRFGIKHGNVMLVAVSADNLNRCKEYFGLKDSSCSFVNNGVDSGKYFTEPHDGFNFINVATHNENKNQGMIIKCFKSVHMAHPDTSLILAGDGPAHEEWVGLAEELGLSDCVYFPGMVSEPEKFYRKADVYIQSSHREAMPMSVLEALMAGMPIIATRAGGLADVVKNNGYLVGDSDENAMTDAMMKIAGMDRSDLSKMKKISLQISKNYSSSAMAEGYMNIYDEMLKK